MRVQFDSKHRSGLLGHSGRRARDEDYLGAKNDEEALGGGSGNQGHRAPKHQSRVDSQSHFQAGQHFDLREAEFLQGDNRQGFSVRRRAMR